MVTNPFERAVDEALRLSEQHESAKAIARQLTEQFSQAVAAKTSGAVTVMLMNESVAAGLADLFKEFASWSAQPRDREDRIIRQYVVAANATSKRLLWRITFAEAGYPVTIDSPDQTSSTGCSTEDDLTEAFVQAASHARVGRKIHGLTVPPELPSGGTP